MSRIAVSKITSKGQLTVPESVRRALKVGQGDRLEWNVEGEKVAVRKLSGRLETLSGLLQSGRRAMSVEQMDAAVSRHLRQGRRGSR